MNKLSIALAVAASLGLAASSAGAADLIDARPVPHVIPAPIEVASGWYIRGDVGTGVADFRDFTLSPADPALKQVQKSIESPPIVGVGVGYQFNDFLRADITGEYFRVNKKLGIRPIKSAIANEPAQTSTTTISPNLNMDEKKDIAHQAVKTYGISQSFHLSISRSCIAPRPK